MRLLITESQLRLLENKTKYDYGFDIFRKLLSNYLPFIEDFEFVKFNVIHGQYYLIVLNLIINEEELFDYYGYNNRSDINEDDIENSILEVYEKVPKNVRYNYPDNHILFPGESAGIEVWKIKFV
jgi:hypothetical protein